VEIILIEHVKGLGERGAKLRVADGYARNFLLPRRLAVAATGGVARQYETLVRQAERREAKLRGSAEAAAARLQGVALSLTAAAGEEGVLFGSVTTARLAEELAKLGHDIPRKQIELDKPIKRLGSYQVTVRFPAGVVAVIPVEVAAG
jgi:large subunit ribosomal protein L9